MSESENPKESGEEFNAPQPTLYQQVYCIYDFICNHINLPSYYCSQCEKRIRHHVYRFEGLIYCQGCADVYTVELEERHGRDIPHPPSF